MTERGEGGPPRALRGPTVAWLSGCSFLAVLALLGYQLRNGDDPALRNVPATRAARGGPRHVLVRRIVRDIVVVHVIPAQPQVVAGGSAAAGSSAAGPAGPAASSPASSSPAAPAPVAAAPAPVAAAPAPAPAPVTRTS